MHSGPGGSLTAVLADLEDIWSHVIQKHLEIPLKELKVKVPNSRKSNQQTNVKCSCVIICFFLVLMSVSTTDAYCWSQTSTTDIM